MICTTTSLTLQVSMTYAHYIPHPPHSQKKQAAAMGRVTNDEARMELDLEATQCVRQPSDRGFEEEDSDVKSGSAMESRGRTSSYDRKVRERRNKAAQMRRGTKVRGPGTQDTAMRVIRCAPAGLLRGRQGVCPSAPWHPGRPEACDGTFSWAQPCDGAKLSAERGRWRSPLNFMLTLTTDASDGWAPTQPWAEAGTTGCSFFY